MSRAPASVAQRQMSASVLATQAHACVCGVCVCGGRGAWHRPLRLVWEIQGVRGSNRAWRPRWWPEGRRGAVRTSSHSAALTAVDGDRGANLENGWGCTKNFASLLVTPLPPSRRPRNHAVCTAPTRHPMPALALQSGISPHQEILRSMPFRPHPQPCHQTQPPTLWPHPAAAPRPPALPSPHPPLTPPPFLRHPAAEATTATSSCRCETPAMTRKSGMRTISVPEIQVDLEGGGDASERPAPWFKDIDETTLRVLNRRFLAQTSGHGLKATVEGGARTRRIVWGLLFTAGCLLFAYTTAVGGGVGRGSAIFLEAASDCLSPAQIATCRGLPQV